jgi:hypothetical protein
MGSASRYWQFVRIDATGQRLVNPIEPAQIFFQQQFPHLQVKADIRDVEVQQHLWQLYQIKSDTKSNTESDMEIASLAECCLRCFISYHIEQVCVRLEEQFGQQYGINRFDLFPLVLDDVNPLKPTSSKKSESAEYQSLAIEILQSFDPKEGNLGSWVIRRVRHHRALNAFLLEQGIYLVSDWAILNDTSSKQVTRILSEFYQATPVEIDHACALLDSYHAVYRRDRLQQRQTKGTRGQCLPPTLSQLHDIAQRLQEKIFLSPEMVLSRLQALAQNLRQYRIHVRSGMFPTQPLDDPKQAARIESQAQPSDEDDLHQQFLTAYRQHFLHCLDAALGQVIGDRLILLARKKPPLDQKFLYALSLFYEKDALMGEIAPLVGMKKQFEVTRLLKLKELRTDTRRWMLADLRDRILTLTQHFTDPVHLQALDQQVDVALLNAALEEQVDGMIATAASETSVPTRPLKSLFARRVCHYLETRRISS